MPPRTMVGVTDEELTLMQAAELMVVGYRQSKRIWKRDQVDGDAGLVHRLQGQPSARRKPPALRARVLARYAEERYADFGPTLMAEAGIIGLVCSWHRFLSFFSITPPPVSTNSKKPQSLCGSRLHGGATGGRRSEARIEIGSGQTSRSQAGL